MSETAYTDARTESKANLLWETLVIVKPETVVRWHRKRFASYWTRQSRRSRPGRPGRDREIREKEIRAFGFEATVTGKTKSAQSTIQSAFLKADTLKHLLVINTNESLTATIPRRQVLKLKIEVDTDPPSGFDTETRFLLQPIPFSVRALSLNDLFAGKMHAVLCRGWKGRVKGRDWYDLVWYIANHPQLHLKHLEQRMIQTGHLKKTERLTPEKLSTIAETVVGKLDVDQARREVEPFVRDPEALTIWSGDFFRDVIRRIVFV